MNIPTQTLTTLDGKCLVVGATASFRIGDVEKLYQTICQPENTILEFAQEGIAKAVTSIASSSLNPAIISNTVSNNTDVTRYGIEDLRVFITDFAYSKSFRLVQDQRYGSYGDVISMDGRRRE